MLKSVTVRRTFSSRFHQRGVTMMEMMVAGATSIIAASGMVMLMASTLGTSSQTIQMTRVTQEMRVAMQIVSRELRRANYNSSYLACYGNPDCLNTLGIAGKIGNIGITDNGDSDCLWFWYDRPQSGNSVSLDSEPVAAFRHTTSAGIGKLQMTTTLTGTPDCTQDANWFDITDTSLMNVLTFNVSNADSFAENIGAAGDTLNVERIELVITARSSANANALSAMDPADTQRELREFVTVRNNTVSNTTTIPVEAGP